MGDITPYCGISKEEKKAKEIAAMQEIAKLIEPKGEHLLELFMVSTRIIYFYIECLFGLLGEHPFSNYFVLYSICRRVVCDRFNY